MGTFTITQKNPNDERLNLYPCANCYGDCTNWSTNAASNYQAIDDEDLDVSEYIYTSSTSTVNELVDKDDPADTITGDINYVKLYAVTQSDVPPTAGMEFYLIIAPNESCVTYYASNEKPLTNDWSKKSYVWENNPSTSSSWTWDDIDDLLIGVRGKSSVVVNDVLLSTTLRPESAGTSTGLHPEPVARNNWDCVDEVVTDDTDYVYAGEAEQEHDLYNLNSDTFGVIDSVTVYIRIKKYPYDGNGVEAIRLYTHDTDYIIGYNAFSHNNWFSHSYKWNSNPSTGAAWTQAEIDDLQVGAELIAAYCSKVYAIVKHYSSDPITIQVAQCYLEVGYTPSSTNCTLNKPTSVSINHNRNVKMLNFWNGEREVYDLSRNSKTTVLKGMEYYNSSCTNPGERISCMKELGKNGATITIEDLNMDCYNGDYKIRSFGWRLISNCPESYEWILELEDTELL